MITMFQVIDRVTGVYCGKVLKSRKSARRKADRLDLEYGAIRYGVLEVTQLSLGGM